MTFDELLESIKNLAELLEQQKKEAKAKKKPTNAIDVELSNTYRWINTINLYKEDLGKMKNLALELQHITRIIERSFDDWSKYTDKRNGLVDKIWHINDCILAQHDWDTPGVTFRPGAEYPK